MVYQERNTWASLIASAIAMVAYVVVTLGQAGAGPLADVNWVPIMAWTIGGSIVGAIALSIVWGIIAGMREPGEVGRTDQRDRDIARLGARVGEGFMIAGGVGALVLCAFEADWFWIANTIFFGFALSAFVGGIVRVIAYRRGIA